MVELKIAFLFDVDGVIAETPHVKAWKDASIEWNLIDKSFNFTPFYQKYVAGMPGLKGAEKILELTGYYKKEKIDNQKRLEEATRFRELKQKFLDEYIEKGDFKVFEDVLAIIQEAKKENIPIAAVSSSENAEKILKKMNILELFDSTALGAKSRRISNKSNLYRFAFGKLCQSTGIDPPYVYPVIFEDADNGVIAAKNAESIVIGIARRGLTTPGSLIEKGADLAYDEAALLEKGYNGIKKDILNLD